MKLIIFIIAAFSFIFSQYEYSFEDMNTTSPSFGQDVWHPVYSDHITLHYFSSQGWSGWTSTFGQLSNFQEDLHNQGYENIVIIAVGQSNISQFNTNFTANSTLPLVMDTYPDLPIREQFNGLHKEVVILGYDYQELGRISLSSGLNNNAQNFISDIIISNYNVFIAGDINDDGIVNVLDVIQAVNMVMNIIEETETADLNMDGIVNVVDVILLVNIIINQ